jgi:hypothetical protein
MKRQFFSYQFSFNINPSVLSIILPILILNKSQYTKHYVKNSLITGYLTYMELNIVLLNVVNEDNSLLGVIIKEEYLIFHSFPFEYKCNS